MLSLRRFPTSLRAGDFLRRLLYGLLFGAIFLLWLGFTSSDLEDVFRLAHHYVVDINTSIQKHLQEQDSAVTNKPTSASIPTINRGEQSSEQLPDPVSRNSLPVAATDSFAAFRRQYAVQSLQTRLQFRLSHCFWQILLYSLEAIVAVCAVGWAYRGVNITDSLRGVGRDFLFNSDGDSTLLKGLAEKTRWRNGKSDDAVAQREQGVAAGGKSSAPTPTSSRIPPQNSREDEHLDPFLIFVRRCLWLGRLNAYRVPWLRFFAYIGCSPVVSLAYGYAYVNLNLSAFLSSLFLHNLAIAVFLHRWGAHRAFRGTNRVVEFLFSVFACLPRQFGPIYWRAVHRKHHTYSDESDEDPHSPVQDGFLYSHMLWLCDRRNFLPSGYVASARKRTVLRAAVSDDHADDFLLRPETWAVEVLFMPIGLWLTQACVMPIFLWVLSSGTTSVGAAAGMNEAYSSVLTGLELGWVLSFHCAWAVNSCVGHPCRNLWPRRWFSSSEKPPNPNSSSTKSPEVMASTSKITPTTSPWSACATKNFVLSVLTLGDAHHEHHHVVPRAAHHGYGGRVLEGNLDPAYYFICFLEKLGLVCEVRHGGFNRQSGASVPKERRKVDMQSEK